MGLEKGREDEGKERERKGGREGKEDPINMGWLRAWTQQVRLHQVNDSPLSSVTGRAAIGLENQLLVHEEVHLSKY